MLKSILVVFMCGASFSLDQAPTEPVPCFPELDGLAQKAAACEWVCWDNYLECENIEITLPSSDRLKSILETGTSAGFVEKTKLLEKLGTGEPIYITALLMTIWASFVEYKEIMFASPSDRKRFTVAATKLIPSLMRDLVSASTFPRV